MEKWDSRWYWTDRADNERRTGKWEDPELCDLGHFGARNEDWSKLWSIAIFPAKPPLIWGKVFSVYHNLNLIYLLNGTDRFLWATMPISLPRLIWPPWNGQRKSLQPALYRTTVQWASSIRYTRLLHHCLIYAARPVNRIDRIDHTRLGDSQFNYSLWTRNTSQTSLHWYTQTRYRVQIWSDLISHSAVEPDRRKCLQFQSDKIKRRWSFNVLLLGNVRVGPDFLIRNMAHAVRFHVPTPAFLCGAHERNLPLHSTADSKNNLFNQSFSCTCGRLSQRTCFGMWNQISGELIQYLLYVFQWTISAFFQISHQMQLAPRKTIRAYE